MTNAYQEIYLNKAMSTLGDVFDSAVYEYGISGSDFVLYFVNSTVCQKLERGEIRYLIGKSGTEIVYDIIREVTGHSTNPTPKYQMGRSPEYWCGWTVCYYHWKTCRSYSEIFQAVSFEELLSLYPALHEADVTKAADVLEQRMQETFPQTRLKQIRTAYGCSQKELSVLSGVSLRSIQMYEQRQKDINHAQAASVYSLAKALGCTMEDLLEK